MFLCFYVTPPLIRWVIINKVRLSHADRHRVLFSFIHQTLYKTMKLFPKTSRSITLPPKRPRGMLFANNVDTPIRTIIKPIMDSKEVTIVTAYAHLPTTLYMVWQILQELKSKCKVTIVIGQKVRGMDRPSRSGSGSAKKKDRLENLGKGFVIETMYDYMAVLLKEDIEKGNVDIRLYRGRTLHPKCIVGDKKVGFGSANATRSGWLGSGNREQWLTLDRYGVHGAWIAYKLRKDAKEIELQSEPINEEVIAWLEGLIQTVSPLHCLCRDTIAHYRSPILTPPKPLQKKRTGGFRLYEWQERVVADLTAFIIRHGFAILCLNTGSGKTPIAKCANAQLVKYIRKLVGEHARDIFDLGNVQSFISVPKPTLKAWEDTVRIGDMIQPTSWLRKETLNTQMTANIADSVFLLLDESHQFLPNFKLDKETGRLGSQRTQNIRYAQSPHLMAISATPGGNNGFDRLLWFFETIVAAHVPQEKAQEVNNLIRLLREEASEQTRESKEAVKRGEKPDDPRRTDKRWEDVAKGIEQIFNDCIVRMSRAEVDMWTRKEGAVNEDGERYGYAEIKDHGRPSRSNLSQTQVDRTSEFENALNDIPPPNTGGGAEKSENRLYREPFSYGSRDGGTYVYHILNHYKQSVASAKTNLEYGHAGEKLKELNPDKWNKAKQIISTQTVQNIDKKKLRAIEDIVEKRGRVLIIGKTEFP